MALTFIGITVIYLGVLYQRTSAARVQAALPESIGTLVPPRARSR